MIRAKVKRAKRSGCKHCDAMRFRMDGTTDIECKVCGARLSDRFIRARFGITHEALIEQRDIVQRSYAIDFPIEPISRLRQ